MIASCIEEITPNLATQYMSAIDPDYKNRNIRNRVVSAYARDMKDGRWELTHQGIAFDENGFLRDGQHRLAAIIESGVTVKMMVTRGIPAGTYAGIDEGAKRSYRDSFGFNKDYCDDPVIRQPSTISAIRSLVRMGYNANLQITVHEVAMIYEEEKEKINSIYRIAISRDGRKNSNVTAAGLAALICGESEENIFKFFSCYYKADISDCDGLNVSAAILWNRQISDSAIKHLSISGQKLYNGTQNAIWNFCNTSNSKLIRSAKNERYPVRGRIAQILKRDS